MNETFIALTGSLSLKIKVRGYFLEFDRILIAFYSLNKTNIIHLKQFCFFVYER